MSKIILASASPRRSDLLKSIGVLFEVVPSTADELHDERQGATALCELNAERKAGDVAARFPNAAVLGADTLVTLEGRIFGKPRDLAEAKTMLRALSGATHEVVTGLCLKHNAGGRNSAFHEVTRVTFKALSDAAIDDYISTVPVLDKAGAYGIQEHGEILVEKIEGSFSNVVGLPLERLGQEFDLWGVTYNKRSL